MTARGRRVTQGHQNDHEWTWIPREEAERMQLDAGVGTASFRRLLPLQRCAHCLIVVRGGCSYLLPGETRFRTIQPRPGCIPADKRGEKGAA